MMERIGLISCGKIKRNEPRQAQDLYKGKLFNLQKRFIQKHCETWFIISGKYGLLRPDQVIEPYKICVSKKPTGTQKGDPDTHYMTAAERRTWAAKVRAQLLDEFEPGPKGTIFLSLLPAEYLEALKGFMVIDPLNGMRQGIRLQWLSRQSRAVKPKTKGET